MHHLLRPLTGLTMCAAVVLAGGTPQAVGQTKVPRIARGAFDARFGVPGTRTIYHRKWSLSPSCLGATCSTIRLGMQRPDGRRDVVTLRRVDGVYRGRIRTRALCRGRLATAAGTISLALRVTGTVQREMVSGRETIITGIGGELRVTSPTGVCPPRRHLGRRVRVTADRTDLPQEPLPDFNVMPLAPSVAAGTNTVQFTDSSAPDQDLVSHTWDFGDPSSGPANRATGKNVTHTYARPGSYVVRLAIIDRYGQVASDVGSIDVLP